MKNWSPGRVLLGEYVITGVLGRGGMGTVYRVRSKTHGNVYAVKTLLDHHIQDAEQKASFLRELRTWVDLPDHPNLIPCCFCRTIGDRLAIFSEYAGGGSLKDWISRNRIRTLETILDIAVQSAWGIHAAHHCGVVHQDIKPANILMTSEGTPRISDFGLARALHVSGVTTSTSHSPDTVLVSSQGMTMAYCSPEQAARQKLDRRTDIWSWGVSILEIFNGQVTWRIGTVAPLVLKNLVDNPSPETGLEIPPAMEEVLDRCFQESPKDRWRSMAEVADRVQDIYPDLTGRQWTRPRPVLPRQSSVIPKLPVLSMSRVLPWTDPVRLLEHVLPQAGMSRDLDRFHSEHTGSVKSRILSCLELFNRALGALSTLSDNGIPGWDFLPVCIQYMEGSLLDLLNDHAGALEKYETARKTILEHPEWPSQAQRRIQVLELLHLKGVMLNKLNRYPEAHAVFEEVLAEGNRLDPDGKNVDVLSIMGSSANFRGIMYFKTAEPVPAMEILEESVRCFEKAAGIRPGDSYPLSVPLMTLAAIHGLKGDEQTASALFDRVIALRKRAVYQENREEHRIALAMACANKANVAPPSEAEELCRKAIALVDDLEYREGRVEHLDCLATMYFTLSNSLLHQDKLPEALESIERAIQEFEYLIGWMGLAELRFQAAAACMNRGNILKDLGRFDESIEMFDRAIRTWERMLREEGRKDLEGTIALTRANRASALMKAGKKEDAFREARNARKVLEAESERTGREDLRRALDLARKVELEAGKEYEL